MNLKHLLLAALACASGLPLVAAESFTWDSINVEFLPAKVPGQIKNIKNEIKEVNSVLGDSSVTIFQLKKEIAFAPHQSSIYIHDHGKISPQKPQGNDYCVLSLKPGVKSDVDIFSHEAQDYAVESVVDGPSGVIISFKSTTYSGLECHFKLRSKIRDLIAILEGEYFGLVIPLPKRVTRKNSQDNIDQIQTENDYTISFQDLSEIEHSDTAKESQKPSSKTRSVFDYFKRK